MCQQALSRPGLQKVLRVPESLQVRLDLAIPLLLDFQKIPDCRPDQAVLERQTHRYSPRAPRVRRDQQDPVIQMDQPLQGFHLLLPVLRILALR